MGTYLFYQKQMSRYHLKEILTLHRAHHVVDCTGVIVGRAATQITRYLQGKHKPIYDRSVDVGDYVICTNVEKVEFSGNKWQDKVYRWHTGWPGGLKEVPASDMIKKHPERVLYKAVNGMLPKNKLRKNYMRRLRLFVGEEHDFVKEVDDPAAKILSPKFKWKEEYPSWISIDMKETDDQYEFWVDIDEDNIELSKKLERRAKFDEHWKHRLNEAIEKHQQQMVEYERVLSRPM